MESTIAMKNKAKGFSLIELMIVVGIIGIIAAVAYPAYQRNIDQAKRSDAQAAILQAIQAQERFFVQNLTYTIDLTQVGYGNATPQSPEGFYTLSAVDCGNGIGGCVNIIATGNASTDGDLAQDSQGGRQFRPTGGVFTAGWPK